MCDKLQASKDGSVDLCHSRFAEYSAQSVKQQYSSNNIIYSSRKQRKYYGKDKKKRSDSSWLGKPCPPADEQDFRSRRDQQKHEGDGGYQGQRWPKQTRGSERRGSREVNEYAETSPRSELSRRLPKGNSGKKKLPPTSLNHLLNFTISSTEGRHTRGGMERTPARRRRRTISHSYNKEEFLQANCQFVVSTCGDYSIHFADPDKLVEWESIQQVRLFCHEIPSCPICLFPPRAAKITRCGHVYCWSCLLHYLSLGEKKWSRCPICNESIYRKDIKSVAALSSPQYKVGDTITMKLMIREKRATQVFPKAEWNNKKSEIITIEDTLVNQFAKLLSATPVQVLSLIIGPERRALEAQLAGLGKDEASEECFIQTALEDLKIRESELTQTHTVYSQIEKLIPVPDDLPVLPPTQCKSPNLTWTAFSDQYFEGGFEPPFSEPEDSEDSSQSVDGDCEKSREVVTLPESPNSLDIDEENLLDTSQSSQSSPKSVTSEGSANDETLPNYLSNQKDLIYFYQASDGQHLYMHPISTKCLAKEYNGLENCPEEITATVIEMEQFTMSEEIRSRYRSLSHLPLTCELALCELDLKPPTISPKTLEYFSEEIHRRRQKRNKKKKEERRREKKMETRNSSTEQTVRVNSSLEMTPEKFHDFLSLASSPSLLETVSLEPCQSQTSKMKEEESSPTQVTEKEKCDSPPPAPSFAQALQGKSPVWPVKASPSSGTGSRQSNLTDQVARCGSDEDFSVPSFQDAFNEAFRTASESVLSSHGEGKPRSKTAKKGRKKLVLFSTGGSRGAS